MIDAINNKGRQVLEEELGADNLWIEASKKAYKMFEGKDFNGDDKKAVQYGLDKMSEFNYNVSFGTIPHTAKVLGAEDETQVAYAYLMDTYEKKDITTAGFGRAMYEAVTDPLNYVGLSTFGIGTVAKKGAQEAGKEGFKMALKEAVNRFAQSNVAKGAVGGAMYAGGQTLAEENIKTSAGLQPEVDYGNVATATAIGGAIGGGIVKGVEQFGKASKEGGEELMKMAGGGTPPQIPIKQRLKGDMLLDAEDMIDELKGINANVDDFGYVTVYHRTSKENAEQIKKTGKMINKEKGIFVSTKKDGSQAEGYGDAVIEMKIPIEDAQIDDMFGDEAHLAIKTKTVGKPIDVSKYLIE